MTLTPGGLVFAVEAGQTTNGMIVTKRCLRSFNLTNLYYYLEFPSSANFIIPISVTRDGNGRKN